MAKNIKTKKVCENPLCNEEFIPTRNNNKYCCPEHKRQKNWNDYEKRMNPFKEIQKGIKNNHDILYDLISKGFKKEIVTGNVLKAKGFDFNSPCKNITITMEEKKYGVLTYNGIGIYCCDQTSEVKQLKDKCFKIHTSL